jgi:hypothetical protein
MKQKKAQQTYNRQFSAAMVVYVISLMGVVVATRYLPETNWNILLAILPAMPMIYGIWAYSGYLEGLDEMQRLIQTKAIVFAAGVVSALTFTYGLLESFANFPPINLLWVFPALTTVWSLGQAYYGRKYG